MSEIDHTACIEALERLQREMQAAMDRANAQIAANRDKLEQLDRTNAALAETQMEMLRQVRNLLETGRTSDALRYVVALCSSDARPQH
jgi:cell division protein FtsB